MKTYEFTEKDMKAVETARYFRELANCLVDSEDDRPLRSTMNSVANAIEDAHFQFIERAMQ